MSWAMQTVRFWSLFLMLIGTAAKPLFGDSAELAVLQDNSIVMVDGEWTVNAGQQGRLRIKGNQHIVAMAFDTSPIVGKKITRATLICVQGEQTISAVSISTIATPWSELRSTGLSCGVDGTTDWGYPGARFPAVCGGNAGTLVAQTDSVLRDGRYHWSVPPDMIHALAIGVAHGLAIHEHAADYGRNPTIFSRDQSGKKPVLLVEFEPSDDPDPQPVTDLRLSGSESAAVQLSFVPPASGFAYDIQIDGNPLGRHNLPLVPSEQARTASASALSPSENLPRQGTTRQTVAIRDLPASVTPDEPHEIRVVTLNRAGKKSAAAVFRGVLFHSSPAGTTVAPEKPMPPQDPVEDNLSVIPVADKFDADGKPVGRLPETYRQANGIFDGRHIRLQAAQGEVISFQLLLRGNGEVSVAAEFEKPLRTDWWQAVFVPASGRRIPDPLLPMPRTVSLQRQQDTVLVADLYVPFDAAPGMQRGKLTVSDGRVVPIELRILPFSIPRQATFFCEMNGYGLPDHVDDYYALQQVAYDHRVHSNILHYSHNTAAPGSRKSNLDMRLRSGRRMDNRKYDAIQPGDREGYWDDFAEAFGPHLDGSLFQHGHRGPIAAPGFYLTFHESWPLNCRQFFNGNPDAFEAFGDQPHYAETFVSILESFVRLAQRNRWTQTGFQVYLNNKGSLHDAAKAPWILDEPSGFWDYRALRYYGELTDRGRKAADGIHIDYRIDISRPEFDRGELGHRADLWVVSSWAFQHYRRLVTDRIQHDGLQAWVYGTSNHVHESNRDVQAWALDARRSGATGIVPWQTVNKDGSALRQADQLGLFIYDRDERDQVVVRHSLRLKAYRDVQQLIEYLNLLQTSRNWSDDQLRQFISHYVTLDSEVQKTSDDDAGTARYSSLTPEDLDSLRNAAAALLSSDLP